MLNHLLCIAVISVVVLAGLPGCLRQSCPLGEQAAYGVRCREMAAMYRAGQYDRVSFIDMTDYFQRRLGISTADLILLLGQPRVVNRGDMYYTHALTLLYGLDVVSNPDWVGGDGHDLVLHYSEYGPPDHRIPDESFNLFFIIKDDKVVGIRTLFP